MQKNKIKVLFDTNILRGGIQREWSTERKTISWGGRTWNVEVPIERDKINKNSEEWVQTEIEYLPKIKILIDQGIIIPYRSFELLMQYFSQMSPYEVYSANIFSGIQWKDAPMPFRVSRIIASALPDSKALVKRQREAVRNNSSDKDYLKWCQLTGLKSGMKRDDLLHLYTAEKAGIDYFLTMDKRFIATTHKLKSLKIKTKAVLPSELLSVADDFTTNPSPASLQ